MTSRWHWGGSTRDEVGMEWTWVHAVGETKDGETAGDGLRVDSCRNPLFRKCPGIKGFIMDLGELKQKE